MNLFVELLHPNCHKLGQFTLTFSRYNVWFNIRLLPVTSLGFYLLFLVATSFCDVWSRFCAVKSVYTKAAGVENDC